MLIEGDKIITDFMEKGLRQAGFTVEAAHDGQTGLHFAFSDTFGQRQLPCGGNNRARVR